MNIGELVNILVEKIAKETYTRWITLNVCATACGFIGQAAMEVLSSKSPNCKKNIDAIVREAVFGSLVNYANILGEEVEVKTPLRLPVELLKKSILDSLEQLEAPLPLELLEVAGCKAMHGDLEKMSLQ